MDEVVSKVADRREQLLAAARAVLAEKGLEGARVSEIVKRAGVSQGTFYLYFPSKVSLVEEFNRQMHRDVQRAVFEAVERAGSIEEGIEASVEAALREMGRYRDILGVVISRLGFYEDSTRLEDLELPYRQMVSRLIEKGQEMGVVDRSLDPRMTARIIVGLIERAGADCYVYEPSLPADRFVAEVARFIRGALGVR